MGVAVPHQAKYAILGRFSVTYQSGPWRGETESGLKGMNILPSWCFQGCLRGSNH